MLTVCTVNLQLIGIHNTMHTAIQCPPLELIANGNFTANEYTGWGGTITYSCDRGYSLVGTKKRTCQKNRSWSGEAPYCQGENYRTTQTSSVARQLSPCTNSVIS